MLRLSFQFLILFVTYGWAQQWTQHYTWLERLATDKHSSLLGPFVYGATTLSITVLSVIMLRVVRLNVVILRVVAPS
jgi:hypothetical protein